MLEVSPMKEFLKSFAFKAIAAVALILIGVMIYAASTGGATTIPSAITGAIVTPLQSLASGISDGFNNFFGLFTDAGELKKENAAMQEELNDLRAKQVELDKLREENQDLKKYLHLIESTDQYTFARGRVVAMDASDKYYNFTINVGSLSGVKANNPIITPEGLVGVVYEVGPSFSKVRTILDPATQVSARISRTGESGITGANLKLTREGLLRLNQLSRESGAATGDYVVTAGIGGVFPADLLIGKITEINTDSNGLSAYALVQPFADIANLTSVLVITEFNGQGESID